MEIMIPVWNRGAGAHIATSDLQALKGASVAFVDDQLDVPFAEQIEHRLRETYGAVVQRFNKPWGNAPSPKSLIEAAAQCRVAVVGIAL